MAVIQLNRKNWVCNKCGRDQPIKRFGRRRDKNGLLVHRYTCKDCEHGHRYQHTGPSGYVPLTRQVWDIFDEITRRLDNQADAARLLGIEPRNLNLILWQKRRFVQIRRYQKALIVLQALRKSNEWRTGPSHKRWRYADEIRCSDCGTDLDNYTNDCSTCWERRRGRDRRRG